MLCFLRFSASLSARAPPTLHSQGLRTPSRVGWPDWSGLTICTSTRRRYKAARAERTISNRASPVCAARHCSAGYRSAVENLQNSAALVRKEREWVPYNKNIYARGPVGRCFLNLRTPRAKPVGLRFLKLRKHTKAVGPRLLKIKGTHESGRSVLFNMSPVRVNVLSAQVELGGGGGR